MAIRTTFTGEKNRNARKCLLERMVVDFGRQFPDQMLDPIQKYEPVPEAPGPLRGGVACSHGAFVDHCSSPASLG
jgi:hypothetical protein